MYWSQGLEFDKKCQILHNFITSTPFKEKSSDRFKDLHKLKLLTNFDVNLTSFLGELRITDYSYFHIGGQLGSASP